MHSTEKKKPALSLVADMDDEDDEAPASSKAGDDDFAAAAEELFEAIKGDDVEAFKEALMAAVMAGAKPHSMD